MPSIGQLGISLTADTSELEKQMRRATRLVQRYARACKKARKEREKLKRVASVNVCTERNYVFEGGLLAINQVRFRYVNGRPRPQE